MPLIKVSNVDKIYQVGELNITALKNVNLEIEPASFVSIIGPSGSGKTTLLNLIGCLDAPSRGHIEIDGVVISDLGRRERSMFRGKNIGFIFQDFNLMPVLTVYENIEYPLIMVQSVEPGERHARVIKMLKEVGMEDQKDKYPDQISGGQKQRVAIARALATKPKLVLADEPTANLDHATAYLVIGLMRKIRDESGTTFVFSTHDQKIVGDAEIIHTLEDGEIKKRSKKKKTTTKIKGK